VRQKDHGSAANDGRADWEHVPNACFAPKGSETSLKACEIKSRLGGGGRARNPRRADFFAAVEAKLGRKTESVRTVGEPDEDFYIIYVASGGSEMQFSEYSIGYRGRWFFC